LPVQPPHAISPATSNYDTTFDEAEVLEESERPDFRMRWERRLYGEAELAQECVKGEANLGGRFSLYLTGDE